MGYARILFAFGLAGGVVLPAAASPVKAKTDITHVVLVMFENTDYSDTITQPFFAKIAKEGAVMSNFHAEAHPSQPNYIALTSGDTQGVRGDGNIDLDVQHIGDLVNAHGGTWRAYAEDWPGGCYTRATSGRYVRKHLPFISYKDVQQSANKCANIVDATQLQKDIAAGTLPTFAYYAPDLDNDGHDTGVAYADNWFSTTFGPLMQDPKFTDGLLLIATFDEDSGTQDNHIYTAFWGPAVKPGTALTDRFDHYSLLRTIEDTLGVGTLGQQDDAATAITGWR